MSREPIHVLHLCHHSVVKQGILRSQVVEPTRRLARDPRLRFTIVSGERVGERDAAAEEQLRDDLARANVAIEFLPKRVGPAARHAQPRRVRRALAPWLLWRDVCAMRRVVANFARRHQPCVVHARSYVPAWAALDAKRRGLCRLIFDPRGTLPEELRDARGWSEDARRFRWWKRLEARLLDAADEVIAVSEPMAAHFAAIGSTAPLLVRNSVDLARFQLGTCTPSRDEPLQLVFLVGVDVPYQASDLALRVRETVAALWPGGARLHIVSPDADAMRARLGGDHVTCESPPRDAIPALLAESDIGVLVRDTSVGSRVACPVKFAEYLAAGLPVIATAGIGECGAILRDHRCGVALDPAAPARWSDALRELVERLDSDHATLRQAARRAAETLFDWDRYLPLIRRAHGVTD